MLGYALKRVDPSLHPWPRGEAAAHDLSHATRTPWMLAHFSPRDLQPSMVRVALDLGLHPTADGRIHLELETHFFGN